MWSFMQCMHAYIIQLMYIILLHDNLIGKYNLYPCSLVKTLPIARKSILNQCEFFKCSLILLQVICFIGIRVKLFIQTTFNSWAIFAKYYANFVQSTVLLK